MANTSLRKKLHSANSYLSVTYGYLQLLKSKLEKKADTKDEEKDWINKSLAACENLKKIISDIENEVKKD